MDKMLTLHHTNLKVWTIHKLIIRAETHYLPLHFVLAALWVVRQKICLFELILTSLSRLKRYSNVSENARNPVSWNSNFKFFHGSILPDPSRSVLLCNMPCLLCKHNFHSATYSVQIIHLLHSLMTTLHYIIFFIWSNPQNKLFVIKMLHDPWAQVIKLMCFHCQFCL